jgi:glucose/arabinose dehydrogenase
MTRPVTRRPVPRRAAARARIAVLVGMVAAMLLPGPAAAVTSRVPDAAGPAAAAPTGSTVRLQKVADVTNPVLAISPPGDDRLFIVLKGGRIRILDGGTLLPEPFLDIAGLVSGGSEQGLLGLAFHPGYASNRRFYVNFTSTAGTTVVREYRASSSNPDRAVPSSARTILRIGQPYANHNGGMLAFGRDGYLYIGMGDGGSGGDPGNRAQDRDSLLGKMLRIDVNGTSGSRNYRVPSSNPYVGRPGRNEVWQRGLRNPWRFSFDRSTGDLWIGDVGQGRYEEVDRARRTSSGPGRGVNWGWRVMEGSHCYRPSSGCNRDGKRLPLVEYSHARNGRCAVTGGYVYRGSAIPALRGWYVYGDYCSGEVWAVAAGASRSSAAPVRLLGAGSGRLVSGFGQDADGELYLCDLANDAVYRIVPG